MPGTPKQPPRKWLKVCEPYWANHSDNGDAMRNAVARENDLAESLGFECEPDDRRGHGWCKFSRESDRTEVWSAWKKFGGVFYPWARGQRGEDGRMLVGTKYYDNFEDAIHDRNARLRRTDAFHDSVEVLS